LAITHGKVRARRAYLIHFGRIIRVVMAFDCFHVGRGRESAVGGLGVTKLSGASNEAVRGKE